MGTLAPIGLGLLALAAPIVALYMLRMRRQERVISSTLLWEQAIRDVRANAPWQRLRPNLLLLLQLLALAALVIALARPFWLGATPLGTNLVVIVDVSGSMGATDVAPSRLERAREEIRKLIDSLPANGQMTIIAAGNGAEVVQSATDNRSTLRAAVDDLRGKSGATDFAEALAIATPAAERLPDTTVVIVGDGGFAPPATLDLRAPIRFIGVGARSENLGITAAATRRAASGAELFVRVQNFGAVEKKTLLSIFDGETLVEARALTVPSGGEAGATIALPPAVGLLRAEIDAQDDLVLDNRVWVRPGGNKGRVLITSAGPNTFLERGLALQPNIVVEQAQGSSGTPSGGGDYDLYVFDGIAPPPELRGPVLLINPPADNGLVNIAGSLTRPVVTTQVQTDPIMRGVDLSKVQIADAQAIDLPDWGRTLAGSNDRPLLLAGETGGRRVAVLAFGLGRSDLPLTLAYPILLSNIVGWLAPEAGSGLPESVRPGEVVQITPRSGVSSVVVADPAGREQRLVPSRGVVLYSATDQPGAYSVREYIGEREIKRSVMTVNLLSGEESNIAPRTPQLIGGAQGTADGGATTRARQEIWRPLLAAGLLILAVEWWIFYRGGWRSLGTTARDLMRDPRAPLRALQAAARGRSRRARRAAR
jgi:hypothetical protein